MAKKRMTLVQFLDALRQHVKTHPFWSNKYGFIRYRRGTVFHACPVVALSGGVGVDGWKAGQELGLARTVTNRLINASDDSSDEPRLRARMLAALGLKE